MSKPPCALATPRAPARFNGRVGALAPLWGLAAALACSGAPEPPSSDGAPDDSASGGISAGSGGGTPSGSSGGSTSSGGDASGGDASGGSTESGGATTGTGGATDGDPPPLPPITIWLAGDSTVANGSTPCPSGWGKFFAEEFNDAVTIVNSAVGGRSVRTWLYDITDQKGGDGECIARTNAGAPIVQARWTDMSSRMMAGDYLFIQFGINDGSSTCPRHVGSSAFRSEYAMMARTAFARGVQPVFVTPVSAIRCSGSTAVGTRGFLSETFDVGAAEEVPVLDLHRWSVELYQSLAFCPAAAGGVSSSTTGPVGDFFCDDHTHFSDVGAARMADVVARAIEDLDLPLARYLAR